MHLNGLEKQHEEQTLPGGQHFVESSSLNEIFGANLLPLMLNVSEVCGGFNSSWWFCFCTVQMDQGGATERPVLWTCETAPSPQENQDTTARLRQENHHQGK